MLEVTWLCRRRSFSFRLFAVDGLASKQSNHALFRLVKGALLDEVQAFFNKDK